MKKSEYIAGLIRHVEDQLVKCEEQYHAITKQAHEAGIGSYALLTEAVRCAGRYHATAALRVTLLINKQDAEQEEAQ